MVNTQSRLDLRNQKASSLACGVFYIVVEIHDVLTTNEVSQCSENVAEASISSQWWQLYEILLWAPRPNNDSSKSELISGWVTDERNHLKRSTHNVWRADHTTASSLSHLLLQTQLSKSNIRSWWLSRWDFGSVAHNTSRTKNNNPVYSSKEIEACQNRQDDTTIITALSNPLLSY